MSSRVNKMARVLSLRGDPEIRGADPNVTPVLELTPEVLGNTYSEENPQGVVDMGVAVNSLVHDIVKDKIKAISDKMTITSEMLNYSSLSCFSLKKAVAGYLGNILNLSRAITAENVFIAGGVGSALDCLMHLICDPGDGLLLSTPCYGMFKVDCSLRSKVKLILVNKTSGTSRPLSSDTLKPTVEEYERAYQKAIQEGVTVRALLVTNPHNPIGYILTKEELQQLVQFAHKHSIHLIVDEIYMKSLVNPDAKFTSVLELEDIPNPDLVHIVWGPSKDFGIPGFKTGFVISCGTTVSKAYDGMGMDFYYSVNKIGQDILAAMLSDWDWLSKVYFPTQMELSRKALKIVTSAFDDLGVPYLRPDAGLFVYTDLRKYVAKLSKDPREGEIKLMNKFVKSGRVYWPSGSTLCMSVEFGWFRPIFTARLDHLEEGIKRICSVLKEIEEMQ